MTTSSVPNASHHSQENNSKETGCIGMQSANHICAKFVTENHKDTYFFIVSMTFTVSSALNRSQHNNNNPTNMHWDTQHTCTTMVTQHNLGTNLHCSAQGINKTLGDGVVRQETIVVQFTKSLCLDSLSELWKWKVLAGCRSFRSHSIECLKLKEARLQSFCCSWSGNTTRRSPSN